MSKMLENFSQEEKEDQEICNRCAQVVDKII